MGTTVGDDTWSSWRPDSATCLKGKNVQAMDGGREQTSALLASSSIRTHRTFVCFVSIQARTSQQAQCISAPVGSVPKRPLARIGPNRHHLGHSYSSHDIIVRAHFTALHAVKKRQRNRVGNQAGGIQYNSFSTASRDSTSHAKALCANLGTSCIYGQQPHEEIQISGETGRRNRDRERCSVC